MKQAQLLISRQEEKQRLQSALVKNNWANEIVDQELTMENLFG